MGLGTQMLGWDADFCRSSPPAASTSSATTTATAAARRSCDTGHPATIPATSLRARAREGAVLARGHGRRRHRRARPARHRPCSRGRGLDGRHDRAEDGDRVPRPGAVVDVDDVVDRRAASRPARAPSAYPFFLAEPPRDQEAVRRGRS